MPKFSKDGDEGAACVNKIEITSDSAQKSGNAQKMQQRQQISLSSRIK